MLPCTAFRLILGVLAVSMLCGALAAQSFDLAAHGRQIVALDGLMRFHPGDDPTFAWANPAFDDHAWPLIQGDRPWYGQGYPYLTGFAWYRFKVTLPSHPGPLAVWVPAIATNFQIFADGHSIIHAWVDKRTYTPGDLVAPGEGGSGSNLQTPDDKDCFYLAPITSALN